LAVRSAALLGRHGAALLGRQTQAAGGPWLVHFTGTLAGANVPDLSGSGSGLTGGTSPAVAVSAQQETYTDDAVGEELTRIDRNGNVHRYIYDVLGRKTSDQVTTLGAGVDSTVQRLDTAYDTQGNAYLFTSYSTPAGTTVVNQVQRAFNGLGQLITEYQSHSGAVNTSTTPKVQYTYSEMANGANHSRLTSIIYPGTGTAAKTVNYNYAAGLDDRISRLTSLADNAGVTLESYSYLGLDTVVECDHPQTGVNLTYIKQAGDTQANTDGGDQYTGLDRFGRVIDQNWYNVNTRTSTDRFQYGYDRDSNPLYRNNLVNTAFGELYHASGAGNGNDSLNQMTGFARGVLSASQQGGVLDTVANPSRTQGWGLDGLGNFSSVTTNGVVQSRTYNQQNEATAVGSNNLTFDNNGNTTTDDTGKTLVYDAWNRLVQGKQGTAVLVSYTFDALNRRVTENPGALKDLYYSSNWQVLEEQVGGVTQAQYVWSPAYMDALVLRDRGAERLYVQQDANWNVTGLVSTAGAVLERYAYDPYGAVTFLNATWGAIADSAYAWVYLQQGGRYDTTSGLYSFRSRDYSPTLGRWVQQDPVSYGAGDTNLYRFLLNRPVNLTDPMGLAPIPPPWTSTPTAPLPGPGALRPNVQDPVADTLTASALGLLTIEQ
jgi:RHS repeat-associated protein